MKILMLGWELPPHNSGGLGMACYHMSKALALQGAEIDFVVPYSADHPGAEFMTVHGASELGPLDHYGPLGAYSGSHWMRDEGFDKAGGRSIRDVQRGYIKFVERLVQERRPDAIHAHDWLTMEAGVRAKQLTGVPLIVHVHATEFDRSGELAGNPIIHEIEYQGLVMADKILAVSNLTKSLIVQRYNIPADKIDVAYNAIDVSHLEGYEYDQATYKYLESLKSEGYTVVGIVSRLTVQKGLTHLVRAAAKASEKHDKLVFLLAGDGEQRDELIELSAELGVADKLFFTGFVRGKHWRDAYNVSDIFVMSSVSEPFGLTALEAAHHDCALVISRQSGVGEVLHSILRYDFWDVDVLADQLIGVATSPALLGQLQGDVKQEYNKLSWHDVARQCMTLYDRMIQGVAA